MDMKNMNQSLYSVALTKDVAKKLLGGNEPDSVLLIASSGDAVANTTWGPTETLESALSTVMSGDSDIDQVIKKALVLKSFADIVGDHHE